MKKTPIRKVSKKQAKRQREWTKRVLRLAEAQDWICARCKKYYGFVGEWGLQGHHTIYRSAMGEDTDENCEVICWKCSAKEHGQNVKEVSR